MKVLWTFSTFWNYALNNTASHTRRLWFPETPLWEAHILCWGINFYLVVACMLQSPQPGGPATEISGCLSPSGITYSPQIAIILYRRPLVRHCQLGQVGQRCFLASHFSAPSPVPFHLGPALIERHDSLRDDIGGFLFDRHWPCADLDIDNWMIMMMAMTCLEPLMIT